MSAFYNEHDPKAAAWLRELIKEGLIAPGEVDERDIRDIRPEELARFTQCHFFAGIGTRSHALRGAGWPDSERVWTASCPCQPFSASGKRAGFADERHLWPAFFHLVRVARPRVCFGEQVASRDGETWLDLVQADMEGEGYRFSPLDLCAAGFGAPHIRQRLFFVAESGCGRELRISGRGAGAEGAAAIERREAGRANEAGNGCSASSVADTERDGRWTDLTRRGTQGRAADGRDGEADGLGSVEHATSDGRGTRASGAALEPCGDAPRPQEQRYGSAHLMADPASDSAGDGRREGRPEPARLERRPDAAQPSSLSGELGDPDLTRPQGRCLQSKERGSECAAGTPGATNGFWRDAEWLPYRDGKLRPVEPGTFPLAHGAAERVGRLRGYGNAIVAPVAEAFMKAYIALQPGGPQ